MALEDNFRDIAERCSLPEGRHAVLLMDRGTMDVLAYVGKDAFDDVLEEFNWTVPQLRDQRYEAVVHLVTAAIGAERFYTLENNKARMVSYRRPVVWRRLHFIQTTRVHETRSWVVSFLILGRFGPRRATAMLRAGMGSWMSS